MFSSIELCHSESTIWLKRLSSSDDENVAIEVRTSPNDMGRVIGKRGRVARAIRTVAQAAADEEGLQSSVEFID